MTTPSRSWLTVDEEYCEEPKTEGEVLLAAVSRIKAILPTGWSVRKSRERAAPNSRRRIDARLELIRGRREAEATYDVEVTVKLGENLIPIVERLVATEQASPTPARPMIMARYINPQQQRVLRDRGVAYADATGNLHLRWEDPLILLSEHGANADPWRGPGRPSTSLRGRTAGQIVRALADFAPPYSVVRLAALSGVSVGAAYRLSDYLRGEGLLTRGERGPITDVAWPELLRRWSVDARHLDTSTTTGYLEPRGLEALVENLRGVAKSLRYAVSGSLAAQPLAPYAEPRLGLVYTDDRGAVASALRLRPVTAGANVLVATPRSQVVYSRSSNWKGITLAAPSQVAADLLSGPGRNPHEGEYLLDWMNEHTDAWRQQPDR